MSQDQTAAVVEEKKDTSVQPEEKPKEKKKKKKSKKSKILLDKEINLDYDYGVPVKLVRFVDCQTKTK